MELNLSSLQLDVLPQLSQRAYRILNASYNSIRTIWIDNMPQGIEEINLEGNYILEDGLLEDWPPTLRSLNLSYNPFRSINETVSWGNLRVLNLSHTGLYDALEGLPNTLEILTISNTSIKSIPSLPAGLKELHADSTVIRMLPWRLPLGIEVLVVSHSRLRNGGIPHFWGNSLRHLDLNCNYLKEMPYNLPDTLEFINLSYNSLEDITREVPKSVKLIHLGRNRITVAPSWLGRRGLFYTIHKNHLTEIPTHGNCLSHFGQWIGPQYSNSALRIQSAWRRSCAGPPLRSWRRLGIIRGDLIALAMIPERAGRFQDISKDGLAYFSQA